MKGEFWIKLPLFFVHYKIFCKFVMFMKNIEI